MTGRERQPEGKETLIFSTPEEAQEFKEQVGERMRRESGPGVVRQREAVGQEVAREFARQGEAVGTLSRPWEHTREEHAEVQGLVNMAFDQDLAMALGRARKSGNYPRNVDLLHDVLTGELYEAIQQRGINRQKVFSWPVKTGVIIIVVTLLLIFILFIISA
ncbi:MAG: hypothetical protein ABIH36_02880 [bacterium]